MSHEHEYRALVQVVLEALRLIGRHGDHLSKIQQEILVDTKKLLDAVKQERTEKESMLALVKANTKALQDISSQNQDMIGQIADLKAKLDAASTGEAGQMKQQIADLTTQVKDLQDAAQAAQADIDSAVSDLSADDADVQAALAANVQPSQGDNGAGSAGSSSSSSSSTASGGGGDQKPDPLPGTGATSQPTSSTDNSGSNPSPTSGDGQPGTGSSTDTAALSGGIADPAVPGSQPPPEDVDAAGQSGRSLGSDPNASQAPKSGA